MARLGCRDRDLVVLAMEVPVPWTRRMRPGGQVTQGGHDLWAVAGAQLVAVLVEDHVPDPVEPVLGSPAPLDPGRDDLGLGTGHREGADPGRPPQHALECVVFFGLGEFFFL